MVVVVCDGGVCKCGVCVRARVCACACVCVMHCGKPMHVHEHPN